MLPHRGGCIRLQRDLAKLEQSVDLRELGIVSKPIDILVPSPSVRSRSKQARTHSWLSMIPPGSMRRVHKNVIVSTPEFVILQLAHRHIRHIPLLDKCVDQYLVEKELLASHGIDAEAPFEDFLGWECIRHLVHVAQVAMEFTGTYRLPTPKTPTARVNKGTGALFKLSICSLGKLRSDAGFVARYSRGPSAFSARHRAHP